MTARIPGCEPEPDLVKGQVRCFKAEVEGILEKSSGKSTKENPPASDPLANVLEEMKATVRDLPLKVAEAVHEAGDPRRRRRLRRLHPVMLEEVMHMTDDPDDPIGLLMVASVIRDELPWLYELAVEAYHAAKSGEPTAVVKEMERVKRISECLAHGPMREEFGPSDRDSHIFLMEFPRMMARILDRCVEAKKSSFRRRGNKASE